MTVLAELRLDFAPRRMKPAICADALTRIPAAQFCNMTWAADAIAACAAHLERAASGDRGAICRWIIDDRAGAQASARLAVLRALCDALIADTFAAHGDIRDVTAFLTRIESDVVGALDRVRQANARVVASDPQSAQFAGALVRMVRLHDRATADHLDAVAGLARRISTALGLDSEAVATIGLAASIHDIGNVGVRTGVLNKPGTLDPGEWRQVRAHAERGAQVLADTPSLAFLAPIVRAHHERVDGRGYPDRLRGDEIPLASRVIAVADAFTAMTTVRAYRPALTRPEALGVLARNAGTQFDGDVVAPTLDLLGYARRRRRAIA